MQAQPIQQANAQERQPQQQSSRSKQIIFILVIYILLVTSSKFGSNTETNSEQILISKLKTDQVPKTSLLFRWFQYGQIYSGQWEKIHQEKKPDDIEVNNIKQFKQFSNSGGKAKIQFISYTDNTLSFGLNIENGQYMDDGYLYGSYNLKNQDNHKFNVVRQGRSAIWTYKQQGVGNISTSTYKIQKIFSTEEVGVSTIDLVSFNFTLTDQDTISVAAQIETAKFKISMKIEEKQSFLAKTMIFALIMFIVAYFSFNAVTSILRKIIQGSQSPERYSILTVLIATLWDSVLCLICFIQAFTNEQNLILFIMPSFMLCILFTNLELRWMLSIYQVNHQSLDLRSIICRFNLISYGSFLLIYPILLFTNLNSWFFMVICLLFLPQIYINAKKGIRPDLNHPFYSKFLMFRFIIIFYARGFPYNVFQLKPNYLLCFVCLLLIVVQYTLLWAQKVYGPKKVLPKFLLPPVFNYKFQQQINLEEGQSQIPQCAICLNSLHINPNDISMQMNNNQMKNDYDNVKIMKTPCQHKYHSRCLIQWMNIKKECPQCRQTLPPFQ